MQCLWMLTEAFDREGQIDFSLLCLEIRQHCTLLWKMMEREPSASAPQVALLPMAVWRLSWPGPHVACAHVAALFTNTLLGVPEVPRCRAGLLSCRLREPLLVTHTCGCSQRLQPKAGLWWAGGVCEVVHVCSFYI